MDARKIRAIGIGGLGALLAALLIGCYPPKPRSEPGGQPGVGAPLAGSFSIPSLRAEGGAISLSDFKGEVVLLDFWATWSPVCRDDLPGLDALHQEFKGRGFSLIGLTVDKGPLVDIQKSVQALSLSYPVGLADDQVLARFGGIRPLPTRLLLDKQGRVQKQYLGAVPLARIRSDVESLLGP